MELSDLRNLWPHQQKCGRNTRDWVQGGWPIDMNWTTFTCSRYQQWFTPQPIYIMISAFVRVCLHVWCCFLRSSWYSLIRIPTRTNNTSISHKPVLVIEYIRVGTNMFLILGQVPWLGYVQNEALFDCCIYICLRIVLLWFVCISCLRLFDLCITFFGDITNAFVRLSRAVLYKHCIWAKCFGLCDGGDFLAIY